MSKDNLTDRTEVDFQKLALDMKNIEVYDINGDKNVPEYGKAVKLLEENIERYLGGKLK
jgi:hypothetical protein